MGVASHSSAPDGMTIVTGAGYGLAHNLLTIDPKSTRYQPESTPLNDTYIVADARIDGRAEFIRRLRVNGCHANSAMSDARLLLMAYTCFGEKMLDFLHGDFAFAIWSPTRRSLFLARDQFGIRPLFYAEISGGLAFASRLESLLTLPEVSQELDDIAVGDFLMFGQYADDELTIYKAARRLPRANRMVINSGSKRVEQYWAPPVGNRIRYRNREDYSRHFYDIFERCVEDRLEGDVIAAEMSGGLDSTSIVAVASEMNVMRTSPRQILTHTFTCERLFPHDEEGRLAGVAAERFGVKNRRWAVEDYPKMVAPPCAWERLTEPAIQFDPATRGLITHEIAKCGANILLSGTGGDALYAAPTPFPDLDLGFIDFLQAIADLLEHRHMHGSLRGLGLRTKLLPHWARHRGWRPTTFPGLDS